MDASALYTRGREASRAQVASLDRRGRTFGTARLGVAALALGLLGGIVWGPLGGLGGWGLLAAGVAFVALVVLHARVLGARDRAAAALRYHERGLARLAHDWDRLPVTSTRFKRPEHPFSSDLDLFGHGSLMQLVDATETGPGEEQLARLLSIVGAGTWPDDVEARQKAVRELAGKQVFRERFAVAGGVMADDKPDAAPLLAWAEGGGAISAFARALGWGVPLALGATFLAGALLGLPARVEEIAVLAALVVGNAVSARLGPLLAAASTREQSVSRWRAMIEAIEDEPFETPLLAALKARFASGVAPASAEIAALARIAGFVDARRNEVFRFFIGPLLMWDVHWGAALLRWRDRAGPRVRAWLGALGEVEALASLGGFAFEHPSFVWPELSAAPGFVARGLGHPLLPDDRRVGNDVVLPGGGRALVVTGSNMSGKSTLLRAVGVGAVLTHAGAPLCARSATLGPSRVATSMRVEDSLEGGVSHFYAELRRLKGVLDLASEADAAPVLFLLDEILHGTNSRERILGACGVVRELLARGALGAVSTHDLGITALERELGGRVENVHLEEQVEGEQMTFDYVLRPGVVKSSNALRLMRAVGIDVREPE